MIKYFVGILFVGLVVLPAEGKDTIWHIQGKGYIFGEKAVVAGQLVWSEDGYYEEFRGTIKTRSEAMQLIFGGNTQGRAEFPKGNLRTRKGDIPIVGAVFNEEMIIYDGHPTLYAPEKLGEFTIHQEEIN